MNNTEPSVDELKVYETLKNVIDPELNVNIVDLGLVYSIGVKDFLIEIEMTFSSKNCPLSDTIQNDIRQKISEFFPDKILNLKIVWEPSWSPDFITPEGLKILNGN